MIERTFIQIGGMPKAGKTVLVEHLLRGFDGYVSVARCIRADNLREPQETRPVSSVELRRYRAAAPSWFEEPGTGRGKLPRPSRGWSDSWKIRMAWG